MAASFARRFDGPILCFAGKLGDCRSMVVPCDHRREGAADERDAVHSGASADAVGAGDRSTSATESRIAPNGEEPAMRQGFRVIDTDTHVNPSLDVLLRYADAEQHVQGRIHVRVGIDDTKALPHRWLLTVGCDARLRGRRRSIAGADGIRARPGVYRVSFVRRAFAPVIAWHDHAPAV